MDSVCRNYHDWTSKFERLLRDSEFAKKEIVKGQDYIRLHHNSDILLNKWDNVVETLIGK